MKVAIGWLLPGGGYLLKRRRAQFALCCTAVCAAFGGGLALGGWNNPPSSGAFGVAAGVAKGLAGGPYLIASIFSHAKLPIDTPPHEYGATLLIAAGMINLLALGDRD